MTAAGQLELDLVALRWRERRASYRPQREPIDPRQFGVEPIAEGAARAFVLQHHYSGTFAASVARYGLHERTGQHRTELVGVAVFAVPMQACAANAYGAAGLPSCDLGRFVLLDRVSGNAETWFLARALRQLGRDKVDRAGASAFGVCLAYSDPVPRVDAAGVLRFAGHFGGIYGHASALCLGRATARTLWLASDASAVSARALSKLRTGDRGAGYA